MTDEFSRTHLTDKPAIVGARWWQESLAISGDPIARRQALMTVGVLGTALVGAGIIGSVMVASSSSDDTRVEKKEALSMQRDYGWSFGAEDEKLTFDGVTYAAFDQSQLGNLVSDMTPAQGTLRPFFDPTLLQSLSATPRLTVTGSTTPVTPLAQALTPYRTPATALAYRQGASLGSLFAAGPSDVLVIADLDGPAAVAFAAGAAGAFEPVLQFRNWPHPLGVVPSHLALGTIVHYQPLFVRQRAARGGRGAPLLVLDRSRLSPYTTEDKEFDNRYVARPPSADSLRSLGIKRVLYVTPSGSYPREMDDLNEDVVAYQKAGLDVRYVAASDFAPDPSAAATPPAPAPGGPALGPDEWPPCHYGGSADSHLAFWTSYPWKPGVAPPKRPPTGLSGLASSRPELRATTFTGAGVGAAKASPTTMGVVPVVVAATTGLIVGAAVSRAGGFRRYGSSGSAGSGSWWSGGG